VHCCPDRGLRAMSELALRDAPVTVVKPDLDQKPHVALF
jgi:hypothetical protein